MAQTENVLFGEKKEEITWRSKKMGKNRKKKT